MNIREIMQVSPVIPVMVIDDVKHAVPLAAALVKGGARVLEITLRTPKALDAIEAIVDKIPEAIVGAGTIVRAEQFAAVKAAGAMFAVTPGLTLALAQAAKACDMPLLPGVMTPADVIMAINAGYDALKFFPAQAAGGIAMLKSLNGPFKEVVFCPTGGITPVNAPDFLSLPNVACIGGSWLCPIDLVESEQWDKITELAQAAVSLKSEGDRQKSH
jgi:2-dehydro-3-deoxyphosphogluconate aldolase/(4S)-4-hydroxy-2-oxoglutarate aldolase